MEPKDVTTQPNLEKLPDPVEELRCLNSLLVDLLTLARILIATRIHGDNSHAFKASIVLCLTRALGVLHSRELTSGILFSLIAKAIGAVADEDWGEADEALGEALSTLHCK